MSQDSNHRGIVYGSLAVAVLMVGSAVHINDTNNKPADGNIDSSDKNGSEITVTNTNTANPNPGNNPFASHSKPLTAPEINKRRIVAFEQSWESWLYNDSREYENTTSEGVFSEEHFKGYFECNISLSSPILTPPIFLNYFAENSACTRLVTLDSDLAKSLGNRLDVNFAEETPSSAVLHLERRLNEINRNQYEMMINGHHSHTYQHCYGTPYHADCVPARLSNRPDLERWKTILQFTSGATETLQNLSAQLGNALHASASALQAHNPSPEVTTYLCQAILGNAANCL